MALSVWVQTERGRKVAEISSLHDTGPLGELFSGLDSSEYPLLSGVDPYYNTIFNSTQLVTVARELARLAASHDRDRPLIQAVRDLALRAADDQLYLIFVGD